MRLLFELDAKDYGTCTRTFVRNSARSILISGERVTMVYSPLLNYYVFPGGGIRKDEDPVDAMIRETLEETGLAVKPGSVREYGYVHRIQKSVKEENVCFVQDNYYYLCEADEQTFEQNLDDYEREEGFCLTYVDPREAIRVNRLPHEGCNTVMLERDTRVLEMLLAEGVL